MHTETSGGPPARATAREWIGLAVLALPTLLLSVDVSVLYLALPNLSSELGADSAEQLWIMDIYSFVLAGFLVTMGTLGDRIGRRRLLLIGAAAFGAASVAAAYATSAEMLIAMRALLGLAGATLTPSTLALIRNMFTDPKQMGTAIGVWFSCFMGGMTLGPLVGGVLLTNFWWGSAFLLGVPFMVLLLVAGPILLPESRDPDAGRLDLVSVVLSLGAILPVIYGLKTLARNGVQADAVAAVAVGLAVGVWFVARQRRLADPLLDLRLFGNRTIRSSLTIMVLTGIVMAGLSLLATVYMQMVLGFSPLRAGVWLIPQNIAMVVGSMAGPALARRIRPAFIMAGGLTLAAFGLATIAQAGDHGLAAVVVGMVVTALGIGLPMSLITSLVMSDAPPEKAGSAASVMETGGELGIALGVATLGTLGTVVYREQLGEPAGVPADALEAANESITTAVVAAGQLPGEAGAALLDAARDAFTGGMATVAGLGTVVFVLMAVLAATTLRGIPATGDAPAEAPGVPAEPEGDPSSQQPERDAALTV
ncbi:MFS transporter [Spirillospora sp. NPDC047279]|uniref:MFS transporter n=1 Tax=Spirillospora sp. NPDC047279 TaxID=3155478 RepID=UPI0033FF2953